jgi:hypothetical protein
MKSVLVRSAGALALGATVLLASCADDVGRNPLLPGEADALSAGEGGQPQFTFLAPLTRRTQGTGEFDPSLPVAVTVCSTPQTPCPEGQVAARFTTAAEDPRSRVRVDDDGQAYLAVWHSERRGGALHRILVSVGDVQLGQVDVRVVATAAERRSVPAGAPSVNQGQALPIRFHVGRGVVAAAQVGTSGGTVETADGEVTLVVPAGALSQEVVLTVQKQETADTTVLPGSLYRFGPAGTIFDVPVKITVSYDPAALPSGVPASALGLYHLGANGIWTRVAGSTVDPANRTVSGEVTHFSLFAVRMFPCALATSFTVGSTIQGELDDNDCPGDNNTTFDYFTLEVPAPTTLYFEARSADFLPNVRLFDLNGHVVANAYPLLPDGIFTRAVVAAGTYRFWIGNTRQARALGTYTLTVRHDAPWEEPCAWRANAFVGVGGSTSNVFRDADCDDPYGDPLNKVHRYFQNMVAGRTYRATISADGPAFVSVWEGMRFAEHRQLAGAGTMTVTYTAPAGGYREFALLGPVGRSYQVAFDEVQANPCGAADPYFVGTYLHGQLTASDCVQESGRYADFYELQLQEQASLSFQVNASTGAFSPLIRVFRDGSPVVMQFGTTGFSRAILAPGNYRVRASSIEGGATGMYSLNAALASHDVEGCEASKNVFVTRGVTAQGTIRSSDCYDQYGHDQGTPGLHVDTYLLLLQAGEKLTVIQSSDGAARLSLWASTGGAISWQKLEETSVAGTVQLEWTAPVTGFVYVHPIARPDISYSVSFSGD